MSHRIGQTFDNIPDTNNALGQYLSRLDEIRNLAGRSKKTRVITYRFSSPIFCCGFM